MDYNEYDVDEEYDDEPEPCKYRNVICDPEYVDDDKDRDE